MSQVFEWLIIGVLVAAAVMYLGRLTWRRWGGSPGGDCCGGDAKSTPRRTDLTIEGRQFRNGRGSRP